MTLGIHTQLKFGGNTIWYPLLCFFIIFTIIIIIIINIIIIIFNKTSNLNWDWARTELEPEAFVTCS